MGRLTTLHHKYFVAPLEDQERELDELGVRRAKIALFLRDPFFEADFVPYLDDLLEQHDPQPSQAKEDMLYQIGVRDGVKLVKRYISQLRDDVRSE